MISQNEPYTLTPNKDRWIIFFGAGILILLINLDATIVNLALPTIGHQFSKSLLSLKWIINIYLISSASLFLFSGRLSEIIGHRIIFLIGTILFCIGSLLAGFTLNWSLLLFARTIQGIGFAFTLSQALVLISENFPKEQQGFAAGLSIILSGIGQAVGPTVGGFMLHVLDWHWIFLINVPFCIVSGFIIFKYCRESYKQIFRTFDLLNSLIFIIALVCFMVAISIFDDAHLFVSFLLFIISILTLALFYYQNKRSNSPLFDFNLFKIPAYNASLLIRFFFVLIWIALLFVVPLYLQNILLYTSIEAGFIMLAMTLLMAIVSPFAGRWSDKIGLRIPLNVGLFSCLICLIMLSIPAVRTNLPLLLLGLLPFGLSSGILIPMTIVGIISSIPLERKGTALGLLFTLTFVGGSIGTSIISIILSSVSWLKFQKLCELSQCQIPQGLLEGDLKSILSGAISVASIHPNLGGLSQIQTQQIVSLIQQSFGFAFSIALFIFILIIPFLLILSRYFK